MLFWGPDAALNKCKLCGTDRYKVEGQSHRAKRRSIKSMRYFPFGSSHLRLFMLPKMTKQMRWHLTWNSAIFKCYSGA